MKQENKAGQIHQVHSCAVKICHKPHCIVPLSTQRISFGLKEFKTAIAGFSCQKKSKDIFSTLQLQKHEKT